MYVKSISAGCRHYAQSCSPKFGWYSFVPRVPSSIRPSLPRNSCYTTTHNCRTLKKHIIKIYKPSVHFSENIVYVRYKVCRYWCKTQRDRRGNPRSHGVIRGDCPSPAVATLSENFHLLILRFSICFWYSIQWILWNLNMDRIRESDHLNFRTFKRETFDREFIRIR